MICSHYSSKYGSGLLLQPDGSSVGWIRIRATFLDYPHVQVTPGGIQIQNTGRCFETSFNVPPGTLNLVSTYPRYNETSFSVTPGGGNLKLGEVT